MGAGCTGDRPAASTAGRAIDAGPERAQLDAGARDATIAAAIAAPLPLVPRPRSLAACRGSLAVDDVIGIVVDEHPAARAVGERLARWLGVGASLVRAIRAGEPGPAHAIVLRLDVDPAQAQRDASVDAPADLEDESYTLDITSERALVHARHPAGLFYAAQTLAQLARTRPVLGAPEAPAARAGMLPCVHIEDAPVYRVRAMHLDVARHFFTKELVEHYVDLLSFYRFNVFHWHLTDDQGFRLSIRSHPELTQVGGASGAYSQSDAREVVAFARDRFVTVVPEIEMPGHARAILASHPELSCTGKKQPVPTTWGVFDDVLCAGNEATYALLRDVLRETTEVFPSRLVHIGGDEVPKARWSACPKCRARMAKDKVSVAALQGAFTKDVGAMLAARGRRMVAWDDALEGGLASDGVVVAWQNVERGRAAALAGHDVVMAPSGTTYFNFWQTHHLSPGHEGYAPWTNVLAFDPMPKGLSAAQAAHVLGGEGALWTEHVITRTDVEWLLLPRLAALSDALWNGPNAPSFVERFTAQRSMLDASGVRYFVEPPAGMPKKKVFLETASLELARPAIHPDAVIRFTLDGSEPTETSPVYDAPVVLRADTDASARVFLPGGRSSFVVRGSFEHATPRPPIQPSMQPSMLREGVSYKYFEADFHDALPDLSHLTAKRTGRLPLLSFDPSFRAEHFAVVYDGWVLAPADGVFRFVARADDGVRVDVDGARVVDDGREHAPRDAEGEIALARGPHTVRVEYFQAGGGKELSLACEGPGMPLGPCRLVSP